MNFENIPEYDPTIEQRDKPRKGEITTQGVWVGRGQTRKLVDPKIIWMMAELGCHDSEICDWYGISESTLKFNFSGYLTKARVQLKQKLRRAQLQAAFNGQPTMLVWLGRNILGQSENNHSTDNNAPLPWTDSE